MNTKQKILKLFYPLLKILNRLSGKNANILKSNTVSKSSFYSLKADLNNGSVIDFSTLAGKKVLLVNTASDCGYTNQYEGLQALHEAQKDNLAIIAFPSNEFGQQEQAGDEKIAEFCKLNYGVSFPLSRKTSVKKGQDQHEVYKWLTNEELNGWNYVAPTWNFCKYLVNEKGELTHFFEAGVEPMGKEMQDAIAERD